MKKYILAIDEGTTSCRAGLFDVQKNQFTRIKSAKFNLFYPQNAWVEFDANEVWNAQKDILIDVANGVKREEIFGIGITNQRESAVAWDRLTGKAIYPAICWQCRRTADFCDNISEEQKKLIKQKTGLITDPYFSASKFKWLYDNIPQIKELAKQNRLCFGTMDSFLIYKFTKGNVFATDTTNASRTMLFDLKCLDWDDDLLAFFKIKREWLPIIISSSEIVGTTDLLGEPLNICSVIGDQQSALVGQCCFKKGMAKNTYGTGCFVLVNTGPNIEEIDKLVTTVAYTVAGKTTYAIEGSVLNAGSLVEWLLSIGLISEPAETEEMACSEKDNGEVYLIPAFTGLGAPYWDSSARGAFIGLTRSTTKNHLVRAVLESMAYSTYDLLSLFESKYIKELRVDGGVAKNNFLLQFQSDILNMKIKLPKMVESTLMGAVYMAGLSSGAYISLNEIGTKWELNKDFSPEMKNKERKFLLDGWHNAVNKVLKN
ncbi:MAG: glycerol kinase [Clostridia bacterium]|nr:glycerol kinase [Clostridia bacterium]